MKKLLLISVVLFSAIALLVAIADTAVLGVSADNTPPQRIQRAKIDTRTIVKFEPKADLRIEWMVVRGCRCNLSNLNAFLVTDVYVEYYSHGPATCTAKVKIEYYDMKAHSNVVFFKNLGEVKPKTGIKTKLVMTGEKLIRKSTGIKATLIITGGVVTDPEPIGNTMTVKDCKGPLVK